MILVSVYLEPEIHDTLCMFGELDEVVNRILNEGSMGKFDITNKPNYYSGRVNCNRYEIMVNNEDYINLKSKYPINSSKISLRRLLQWFVYDEVFDLLGWKPLRQYTDRYKQKFNKIKGGIISNLIKLKKVSTKSQSTKIDKIILQLNEV